MDPITSVRSVVEKELSHSRVPSRPPSSVCGVSRYLDPLPALHACAALQNDSNGGSVALVSLVMSLLLDESRRLNRAFFACISTFVQSGQILAKDLRLGCERSPLLSVKRLLALSQASVSPARYVFHAITIADRGSELCSRLVQACAQSSVRPTLETRLFVDIFDSGDAVACGGFVDEMLRVHVLKKSDRTYVRCSNALLLCGGRRDRLKEVALRLVAGVDSELRELPLDVLGWCIDLSVEFSGLWSFWCTLLSPDELGQMLFPPLSAENDPAGRTQQLQWCVVLPLLRKLCTSAETAATVATWLSERVDSAVRLTRRHEFMHCVIIARAIESDPSNATYAPTYAAWFEECCARAVWRVPKNLRFVLQCLQDVAQDETEDMVALHERVLQDVHSKAVALQYRSSLKEHVDEPSASDVLAFALSELAQGGEGPPASLLALHFSQPDWFQRVLVPHVLRQPRDTMEQLLLVMCTGGLIEPYAPLLHSTPDVAGFARILLQAVKTSAWDELGEALVGALGTSIPQTVTVLLYLPAIALGNNPNRASVGVELSRMVANVVRSTHHEDAVVLYLRKSLTTSTGLLQMVYLLLVALGHKAIDVSIPDFDSPQAIFHFVNTCNAWSSAMAMLAPEDMSIGADRLERLRWLYERCVRYIDPHETLVCARLGLALSQPSPALHAALRQQVPLRVMLQFELATTAQAVWLPHAHMAGLQVLVDRALQFECGGDPQRLCALLWSILANTEPQPTVAYTSMVCIFQQQLHACYPGAWVVDVMNTADVAHALTALPLVPAHFWRPFASALVEWIIRCGDRALSLPRDTAIHLARIALQGRQGLIGQLLDFPVVAARLALDAAVWRPIRMEALRLHTAKRVGAHLAVIDSLLPLLEGSDRHLFATSQSTMHWNTAARALAAEKPEHVAALTVLLDATGGPLFSRIRRVVETVEACEASWLRMRASVSLRKRDRE